MESHAHTPLLDERFLLFEMLGRGGMGSVYRAFDRAERRLVAVKVAGTRDAEGEPDLLTSEFRAWCRLRHPNIIRAYEMGRARRGPLPPGTPYLVLESFTGRPAHRVLTPGGVSPERLEELTRRVLEALGHVHDAGLVHRDLKPANILVGATRRGPMRVKLTDFGLATEAGRSGQPGRVSGSIPYVSPESILGLPLDGRADLYGLGVLLFFLAAGKKPVESDDPRAMLLWHLAGDRPEAAADLAALPERLGRFIVRLLSRGRDERPRSAREALALLGAGADSRPRPLPWRVDRGDLATLRLAFDATRRGARRVLRLPANRRAATALVGEARTLAQANGIAFHLVRSEECLARLALRLLERQGERVRSLMDRYELSASLPIDLIGDCPVWDPTQAGIAREHPPRRPGSLANRLAAFVVEATARHPLVLVAGSSALETPLVRDVVARLETSLRGLTGPGGGSGGLFLVVGGRPPAVAFRPRCRYPSRTGGGGLPVFSPQFSVRNGETDG